MPLLRSHHVLGNLPEDHRSQVRKGILIEGKNLEVSRVFHNTFHQELNCVTMLIKKKKNPFFFFFASVKGGGYYLLNTGLPM